MKKPLIILVALFFSFSGHALIELRAHFGAQTLSTDFDSALGDSTVAAAAPDLPALAPYGADVVVNLPLVPIGFGLRYETTGFSVSSNDGLSFDISSTNTSLLINKRFLDLFGYFGVLATYGVSNSNSSNYSLSTTIGTRDPGQYDLMTGTPTVYQLGIEGGVKLLGFIVGGELGYGAHKFSDVDLSGTYFKLILGFGF